MKNKALVYTKPDFSAYEAQSLTRVASGFESDIYLVHAQRRANAKSLIGLISVRLKEGDEFSITVDGNDEEEALEEIINFFTE